MICQLLSRSSSIRVVSSRLHVFLPWLRPTSSYCTFNRHNGFELRTTSCSISPLRNLSNQRDSRYQGSQKDGSRFSSALLPSLAVAVLVGSVFTLRWYFDQVDDHPITREPQIPVQSDEDKSDLKSVAKSGLSTGVLDSLPVSDASNDIEDEKTRSTPNSVVTEPTELAQSPITFIDKSKVGFPTHVRYLIVGAGTAGLAAARAIRASDPKSKILMIAGGGGPDDSGEPGIMETNLIEPPPYLRPPLSKELWRRSKERVQKLLRTSGDVRRHSWLYYEAESFFAKAEDLASLEYGGVALHRGDPVVRLLTDTHTAILSSGRKVTYDRCLLATGGRPKRLYDLEVCPQTKRNLVDMNFISYFRNLADYKQLRELVEKYRRIGGKIAIVGGGFLGSELTVSLLTIPETNPSEKTVDGTAYKAEESQLSVSHIFRESAPMGHILPPCLASATARFEASKKAELWPSSSVVSIVLLEDGKSVAEGTESAAQQQMLASNENTTPTPQRVRIRIRQSTLNGDKVEDMDVDHIVCVVGVRPNTELANEAGLEIDPTNGGFLVNAEFEARSGLFVAGDAASYWDPVLGCRRRVEHLNFAEETGTLAGKNMAAPYEPKSNSDEQPYDSSSSYELAPYQFQSSLWSNLGRDINWDAVGDVDCRKLLTRSYFVASTEHEKGGGETNQTIPDSQFGRLGHGVVFYLTPKEKRLVGILLWNLPDEIYTDDEFAAPSRLNLARSLLAQRLRIGQDSDVGEDEQLRQLASKFDLIGELAQDYADFKIYTEAKKQELLSLVDQPSESKESIEHSSEPPSSDPLPDTTEQ